MPKLNKVAAQRRLVELDVNARDISTATGIPERTLQNALYGLDAMRPARVCKVVRFFAPRLGLTYDEAYAELVASGTPTKPPDQPMAPPGPGPRRDQQQNPNPSRPKPDVRRPRQNATVESVAS